MKCLLLLATFSVAFAKRQGGMYIRGRPFSDPEYCWLYPETQFFVHENCNQFYECDEDFNMIEGWCPDDLPIFDPSGFCGTEDEAVCWWDDVDNPDVNEDSECPLNTDEVVFLPGDYCDEYYICLNGVPNLFACRDGQHWNEAQNYCDEPHLAGCDENAIETHPQSLPDCEANFVGTKAHPQNCNWFIYCDNGGRSIQQCQHLFHYDINLNRCIFINNAKCVKDE